MPVIVNSIDSGITQAVTIAGADVAEEQEQHRDDQQRALDQVLLDGLDGRFDQMGAVVDRARDRRPPGATS